MNRLALVAIATATALATVVATAVPAIAAPSETSELAPVVVDGTVAVQVPAASVPAVDSEIGRGAPLGTVPEAAVPLGVGSATSALVRISALSARADTTVFRAGGMPVLFAPAGGSASTSILLPVRDGAVALWADAALDVRLEVLATFSGRAEQPGSMLSLATPVLRADTAAGLAATSVGAAEVPVGVVGAGEVPSDAVRAVYLTVEVTTDSAVTLQVGGQALALPAGRSVVTTIVAPDDKGVVALRSLGPAVQLRAWVSGWIPDAAFQASQQNLPGSFDLTVAADDGGSVRLRDAEGPVPLDVTRRVDAAYSLVLVSVNAATETTVADIGRPSAGRGSGAVVDAARGALPQLTVMPAGRDGENRATLRRGTATLTWSPVGDILGEETRAPAAADPTIAVVSPGEGAHVDLGEGGYFTLSGTLDAPEGGIDRVEVAGPDGLIGTADVFVEDDRVKWEFGAAAPADGAYTYTATVFDRAGASASAARSVVVEAVDEEDIVIAPDVWVFNEDAQAPELTIVDENTVELSIEPAFSPGDRIVAAVSPGTPEGLYAEVRAFDRVGERWRVTTTPAELAEVFYQVDIDQDTTYTDLGATTIDDDLRDDPDNTPGTVYGEGDSGYETAYIARGSDVDLTEAACGTDPLQTGSEDGIDETSTGACASVPEEDAGVEAVGFATRAVPAASSENTYETTLGFNGNVKWEWKDATKPPSFSDYYKSKADPDAAMNDEFREMVRAKKEGLTLSLKAQVGIKTAFKLETDITWKWGFLPTGISFKSFKISLTTTLKASLGFKAFVSGTQTLSAYNTIASFSLPTVTVMAGPVPIILTNGIETAMRTESKIEAALSGEIVISRTDVFGYEYTNAHGWKRIDEAPKTKFDPFSPKSLESLELKLTGQIATGPVMKAKTKLWGLAGPEIEVAAQAGIKATAVFHPVVPELYLTLGLFVKLGLSAKVALGDSVKKFADMLGAKFELEIVSSEWSWDIWKGKHYVLAPPKSPPAGVRGDPRAPALAA